MNINHKMVSDRPRKSSIEVLNELTGNLPYFNCDLCKNKGVIYFYDKDGNECCRDCECLKKRDMWRRLEKSGLDGIIKKYNFNNYLTNEKWQADIKTKALNFLKKENGAFLIGGAVGAGKTHICTALAGQFIKKGYDLIYMQWREESVHIKSNANTAEYEKLVKPLKNVKVLYIDDLFKTLQGTPPTAADINLAFEIINFRYNSKNKITIVSTEKTIGELIEIDEAIASRLIEMCGDWIFSINKDIKKNYRLKNILK